MIRTAFCAAAALLAAASAAPAFAQSGTRAECLAAAYDSYVNAQRRYQAGVQALVAKHAPGLAAFAAIARDQQLAAIEARRHAFRATLRDNPSALRTDWRVNQWLDWGSTERDRLRTRDPEYARLVARNDSLQFRLQGAAEWPALHQLMQDVIAPALEHAELVRAVGEAATRATAACPPPDPLPRR